VISKHDTISLFGNKSLRASCFVSYVWNIIEDKILYVLGMTNSNTITVYIDNDSIIFSATSNHNILCVERFNFFYDHVLTSMTDLCITLTVNFISSKIKKINYDMCSFYYDIENKEDDGMIEIYCDAYYDIESYKDFKTEITIQLARELQYLIHRNIIESNIDTCEVAKIDSVFECVNIVRKVKSISFKSAADYLLNIDKVSIEEYQEVCNINKEVEHEIRKQQ